MMRENNHAARTVFGAAVTLTTPGERTRYLDEACEGRPELRRRVEELLQAHDQAGTFLEGGAMEREQTAEGAGTTLGHYKILQQIGEGGFGVVFMAEQTEPVRRRVALKVVKPGMDSREVVARFEVERQALALMDHPNIAKVFDAGTTETGRPYFVMELVPGLPVTRYCDEHDLPVAERLELFTRICHAVQHAHQKGVIHRDLKPSNILVTEIDDEAVPKVIDFGVAKALGRQLTENTLFTVFQQMVGTPAYMSPEQTALGGTDIDTRSDVYSLGVLLYELLTGVTPIATETLREAGLDEVQRMIRETEPQKPSICLRTMGGGLLEVARHRHAEPSSLTRFVHGDLDWIVMKALEKDRARRYQTIAALVEDIEHHLASEPVTAGPPGVLYRARKFMRRHKLGAGISAAAVAAVLLSVAALAYGFVQVRQERDRALAAETRAETGARKATDEAAVSAAVNSFLLDDLLGQASPEIQPDRDIKLRTLVDRAAEMARERFRDQPPVELQVRLTLLSVYRDLGEFGKARGELERAIELCRQQQLTGEDPTWLGVRHAEGRLLCREGHTEEAQELYEELLPIRCRVLEPEHPDTLASMNNLALVYLLQGKPAQAQELCEELLPVERRVHGPEHPSTLKTMLNLAAAFLDHEKPTRAQKLFEEALPLWREGQGPEHPGTLMTMQGLAKAYLGQGKPAEAREILEDILPTMQRVLRPEHPYTLETAGMLESIRQGQSGDKDTHRSPTKSKP